jgi:hypothetical protein
MAGTVLAVTWFVRTQNHRQLYPKQIQNSQVNVPQHRQTAAIPLSLS